MATGLRLVHCPVLKQEEFLQNEGKAQEAFGQDTGITIRKCDVTKPAAYAADLCALHSRSRMLLRMSTSLVSLTQRLSPCCDRCA
jgi:hypothetical protein